MYHAISTAFCAVLMLLSPYATGQAVNSLNINVDNGLPTNHLYRMIVDKHGYLWIASDKGVLRYNGYTFKQFSLPEGLPNEDIWELNEDKKGRIWLGSHSNEIGYLLNNKYHAAHTGKIDYTLYPTYLRYNDSGLLFYSIDYRASENRQRQQEIALFVEKNDSIRSYLIKQFNFDSGYAPQRSLVFIAPDCQTYIIIDYRIYKLLTNPFDINESKHPIVKKIGSADSVVANKLHGNALFPVVEHTVVWYNTDSIAFLDLETGKCQFTAPAQWGFKENVNYVYPDVDYNYFYVITERHVLKFDKHRNFITSYPLDQLITADEPGPAIKTFLQDTNWNNCIGTTTSGLWLHFYEKNEFTNAHVDLRTYKYVGGLDDSIAFWWNTQRKVLIKMERGKPPIYLKSNELQSIRNIKHFSNDTFFIGGYPACLLKSTDNSIHQWPDQEHGQIRNFCTDKRGRFFVLTSEGLCSSADKYDRNVVPIDKDRYDRLEYDWLRDNYWAFNNDKIRVHSDTGDVIYSNRFSPFGVNKVEKIVFDKLYGNVFFRGYEHVNMYYPEGKTSTRLLPNYNLKDVQLLVHRNKFIVAGQFGVAISVINGHNKISEPTVFHNIKNINYHHMYDCVVFDGEIIINTDRGTYKLNIPADSILLRKSNIGKPPQQRFIVTYNDNIWNISAGDTVQMNQKNHTLELDLVNPYGNGAIKFACLLPGDSVWQDLNGSELSLPHSLQPDHYYKLYIRAWDNVWRSAPVLLYIYIEPTWWQTAAGHRVIWLLSSISVVLLFALAILITRRIVINTNRKRNIQMELELKAIYSQINPHFIFNSLNSALLLVSKNQMADAYTHISKFSRLLRSYIRSSRNKYISIADEINNLRDYIELQQTRFKNKIQYEIIADDKLDLSQTKLPSLLLQPFVENAINHGILPKDSGGRLTIRFAPSDLANTLAVTIDDNGIGRSEAQNRKKEESKDTSYGNLLIKDLVSIFNRYEHMNIEIIYTDKAHPESGTIVNILIKNPQHDK